jgi:hypothetical protein
MATATQVKAKEEYEKMSDEELHVALAEKCPTEIADIPAVTPENRHLVIAFLKVFSG